MATVTEKQDSVILPLPLHSNDDPAPSAKSDDRGLWAVLAGLRLALALMVVVAHIHLVVSPNDPISRLYLSAGYAPVVLFFVISGYSIAHSITTQPKGYLQRRAWRILPVYWMGLALSYGTFVAFGPEFHFGTLTAGGHPELPEIRTTLSAMFLLQEFTSKPPTINPAIWSLSIEVFFYLLAPLFVRMPRRALVGLMICSMLYGVTCSLHWPGLILSDLYGLKAPLMLWAWMGGWLLYQTRWASWVQAALIGGGVLVVQMTDIVEMRPYTLAAFVIGMLLIVNAGKIKISNKRHRAVLNWLGDVSYPVYVAHFAVFAWCSMLFPWHTGIYYIGAVILVAATLDTIDKRINFLRRSAAERSP